MVSSTYSQGYFECSHLRCAAVRWCHSPPRPSAAAVPAHLQWGTRSTHVGALCVLPVGTVSPRTCSMRRNAGLTFRLDGRRLRLCRCTCSGVLGVLRVGHSAYSRGCRLHTPLVLSSVAGPAACCENKQTRLRRQRQQATHRCGCEQPRYCALLSRSAKPVATVPCRTWACARRMDREERTAGRGLRRQTTPSLPSAAVTCAKQRCAHIHTCVHTLARMRFRTSHVDRSATPSGSVPCSVQVRRKESRETAVHPLAASHALAHHSARPWGPCTFAQIPYSEYSQRVLCAPLGQAVGTEPFTAVCGRCDGRCSVLHRDTAKQRCVVGFHHGELRVPTMGYSECPSGVL